MDPRASILQNIRQVISIPTAVYLHSSRFSVLVRMPLSISLVMALLTSFSQRYRPAEFCLTVGAPLPSNFVEVCRSAGIPLDVDDKMGGVWEDDVKVRGAGAVPLKVREAEEEDAVQALRGTWYGSS